MSGACFRFADSPWSRPFPPRTPQGFAPPCSPASTVILPRPTSSLRSSQASVLLPFAAPARLPGRSEDLPGPDEGRTDVHGVSDAAKLPCTSPSRGAGDVAFDELDRLGAPNYLTFGAQYPCPHAPLPTLQPRPHGRRCTARGETRSATPFVSRDSHSLPFTSSPGAPNLPDPLRNPGKLPMAALGDYRGRDAGYPAPPAQIRTCPLRHPAPPLGWTDGESAVRPRVSDFQPGPMGSGQSRDVSPCGAVLLRPAA